MVFKLRADQIHYLSFEGGGGKGAAFIGALAALAEMPNAKIFNKIEQSPGVFDYRLNTSKIKGVAGASAGAITGSIPGERIRFEGHSFIRN